MPNFRLRGVRFLACICLVPTQARCAPSPTLLLSSRSTTSEVVHDKFFIPALASIGVLLLIALLCCYMIARGSAGSRGYPRGLRWSAPIQAGGGHAYPPISPFLNDGAGDNPATLARRPSKVQRKPAPPLLASPAGSPPLVSGPGMVQPYGDHVLYLPQTDQGRAAYPENPSSQPPQAQWGQHPAPPITVLSSGQSSTQVGSDAESPKTKPYSANGGYGFSGQGQGEFGAHHAAENSQPSTFASNYNPYGGIDPSYDGEQAATSPQQTPPVYYDPYNAGAQHYDTRKPVS